MQLPEDGFGCFGEIGRESVLSHDSLDGYLITKC